MKIYRKRTARIWQAMIPLLLFVWTSSPWIQAQEKPVTILEYFDDPNGIEILDSEGYRMVEVYFGMELSEGDRIRTTASTAELRLSPNGSILKLSRNTEFRIETLAGSKSPDTNAFSLASGKLRTVAARRRGASFQIRTPSAVCGVRGTDFAMEVREGVREGVAVREGVVEFAKNTGERISLTSGQAADVFAPAFQPIPLSPEQLDELFRDVSFEKLDPAAVPREESAPKRETPPPPRRNLPPRPRNPNLQASRKATWPWKSDRSPSTTRPIPG
ncbi:MAG: hypothetical protein Kow009_05540 [Spirochaetales bacterium]